MNAYRSVVRAAILAAAIAAEGCAPRHTALVTEAEKTIVERIRNVRMLRTRLAPLWEGFDSPQYDTPLCYYTDSVCYVANPDDRFIEKVRARRIYDDGEIVLFKTALPDDRPFHMETQLEFGDTSRYDYMSPYLHCSSPELTAAAVPDVTNDSLWYPMVLHEYVHGRQYAIGEYAAAVARSLPAHSEEELLRLHKVDSLEWFDAMIKAENGALLDAVAAAGDGSRRASIGEFLALRAQRKSLMAERLGADALRDEEFFELMESMARYMEAAAGFCLGSCSDKDTWLYDTDRTGYFFATGYNIVRLMDSCGIDKSRLYTSEMRPLEYFLRQAVE